jgi:hypothetical protein
VVATREAQGRNVSLGRSVRSRLSQIHGLRESIICLREPINCLRESIFCLREQINCLRESILCLQEQINCLRESIFCLREQINCLRESTFCLRESIFCLREQINCLRESIFCLWEPINCLRESANTPFLVSHTVLTVDYYACGVARTVFGSAAVVLKTLVAMAMIEPTSLRFAGMIIELPVLASSPNCLMYSSASRSCMAS